MYASYSVSDSSEYTVELSSLFKKMLILQDSIIFLFKENDFFLEGILQESFKINIFSMIILQDIHFLKES